MPLSVFSLKTDLSSWHANFKRFLVAFTLFFSAISCHAVEPTDASIRVLLDVSKFTLAHRTILEGMESDIKQEYTGLNLGRTISITEKRMLDNLLEKVLALALSEFSYQKMEAKEISFYRDNFNQFEIDGLIQFYRTSVGQSVAGKTGATFLKNLREMQEKTKEFQQRVDLIIRELKNEAK
jgi:uncharacterized protein